MKQACEACDHNIPFPTAGCKLALLKKTCEPKPLFDAKPVLAEKEAKNAGRRKKSK